MAAAASARAAVTDAPTTQAPAAEARRAPARRPRALPTVLAALACFGVAFEFLVFQLSAGNDPALGGAQAAVSAQANARPVKKRIVITRVVGASAGGSVATSSGTGAVASAPAPAPVTTATS